MLQTSISKEQVSLYKGRPPDLLRGPKVQRQVGVFSLHFAILAKTFLADRYSARAFETVVFFPRFKDSFSS